MEGTAWLWGDARGCACTFATVLSVLVRERCVPLHRGWAPLVALKSRGGEPLAERWP